MKQRAVLIAGGIIFFLVACGLFLGLAGLLGWQILQPDESGRVVRINLAPPLRLGTAQPPEQAPASEPPLAEPVSPESGPAPATAEPSAGIPPAPANDLPPEQVEQILGFSLPAGTVNSVTQEGVGTRLVIPRLNLDAPIVIAPIKNQTWQVDHLGQAVGHLEGTAPPGANGNLVLAGHVTLSAGVYGPFAGLAQLAPGDLITVFQDGQQFNYVVEGQQLVDRTAVEVTYPTNEPRITLITCSNWNGEAGRYEQRLIVTGRLASP